MIISRPSARPPLPRVTDFFKDRAWSPVAGTGFLLLNTQLVTGNRVGINSILEDGEADKSGTKENEREESDRFEDCNKMSQSASTSHVKLANFNFEHPRPPAFITCKHLGNRLQEGFFKAGMTCLEPCRLLLHRTLDGTNVLGPPDYYKYSEPVHHSSWPLASSL